MDCAYEIDFTIYMPQLLHDIQLCPSAQHNVHLPITT